jgi:uncharacterized membrane protein YgaE (UPF0421/DUF939 family)
MGDERTPDEERSRQGTLIGVGVAIGAGVGATLFAITGSPVFIGVMAAIGVAVGAALGAGRSS